MNQETNQEKTRIIHIPTPHEQAFYFGARNHQAVSDTILLHQRLGMKLALSSGVPQCDLLLDRANGKKIGIIPRIALTAVWHKAQIYHDQKTTEKLGISEREWEACLEHMTDFFKNDQNFQEDRPLLIQDLMNLSELTFERMFLPKADKVILLIDAAIKGDIQETARLKKRWKRIKKYLHKVPVSADKGGIFSEEDTAILHRNGIYYLNQFRKQDIYALKNMLLSHPMTHLVEEINAAFKEDLAKRRDFRYKFYPLLFGCLSLLGVAIVGYEHKYTLIKNLNMTLVIIALTAAFVIDCAAIVYGVFRAMNRRHKHPEYCYFSKPVRTVFGFFVAFAVFSLGSATVFYQRYDGYDDILYYRDLSNGTIAIAGLRDETVDTLTVPSAMDGKTVTEIDIACFRNDAISTVNIVPQQINIDRYAFIGCSSLASVDLSGATAIGAHAFEDCTSMMLVKLPETAAYTEVQKATFKNCQSLLNVSGLSNITVFGEEAFYDCLNLSGFAFNEQLISIGERAFFNCSCFDLVQIPATIQTLGEEAFVGCNRLSHITVPFIATERGKEEEYSLSNFFSCDQTAFSLTLTEATGIYTKSLDDCTSLYSLSLPDGLTVIEAGAFNGLTSLSTMNVPVGVTVIEESCFEDCTTLVEIKGCEGITTIGARAFKNCSSLTSISLPATVEICDEAFEGCASLSVVEFSASLTTLGNEAFRACTAINTLFVPDSVITVGKNAFAECLALQTVSVPFVGESRDMTENGFELMFGSNKGFASMTVTSMHTVSSTAFNGAEHFSELHLNDGITNIEAEAFKGFHSLRELRLPATLTTIGNGAFEDCVALTAMDLSASAITEMGEGLFANCTALSSVILPANCTALPAAMFQNCTSLTAVALPVGIVAIGDNAFNGSALQAIALEEGITTIGERAFYHCVGLTEIAVPGSVTSIGEHAFADCLSLLSARVPFLGKDAGSNQNGYRYLFQNDHALTSLSVTAMTSIATSTFDGGEQITTLSLNEGLTVIEAEAFEEFYNLREIYLPTTLNTIGKGAFKSCTALTAMDLSTSAITEMGASVFANCSALSSIVLPTNCSALPAGMFQNCTSLTSISLPAGIVTIGDNAFNGSALQTIVLQEGITSIGAKAFNNCFGLTEITVPGSVTAIGKNAFANCPSLLSARVPFLGKNANSNKKGYRYLFQNDYALTSLSVTAMTVINRNTFTGGEQLIALSLNEGITKIEKTAFENFALTSITLPSTVTSLGKSAFSGCYQLTTVDLSATAIAKLEQNTFKNCTALTTLSLPGTLTNIGPKTFEGSGSLVEIHLNEGLTTVEEAAFKDCHSLQVIAFPTTLTTLEKNTFENCTALQSMDLAASAVTVVGDDAFKNCVSLSYLTLPNTLLAIPNGFATGCGALTEIQLPPQLREIGDRAFAESGLQAITFPATVEYIGKEAFANCHSMTDLIIPDSVTEIGKNAFAYCYSLHTVQLPFLGESRDNVNNGYKHLFGSSYNISTITTTAMTVIGENTFAGAEYVTTLHFNEGLTEIKGGAFNGFSEMTTITFPTTLTTIGQKAFFNCTALTSVDLSHTAVNSIGKQAFSGCLNLQYLSLSQSLTVIPDYMASNCDSLETVNVPTGLTSIGKSAFFNCKALVSMDSIGTILPSFTVSIPAGVSEIGAHAFEDCTNISAIYFGTGLKKINSKAFYGCYSITTVALQEGLVEIGQRAFADCSSLESISIPTSTTKIGSGVCDGCSSLYEITLPFVGKTATSAKKMNYFTDSRTVSIVTVTAAKKIANRAFVPCSNLTVLSLNDGIEEIGEDIVSGCDDLMFVNLPSSLSEYEHLFPEYTVYYVS